MPLHRLVSAATALGLAATPLLAQQSSGWFLQVAGGPNSRTVGHLSGAATNGIFAEARVGRALGKHVALVGELSLANFPRELHIGGPLIRDTVSNGPGGGNFQPSGSYSASLGLLGASVGVQPHLRSGPFELLATGSVGGYWIYKADAGFPSATPGLHGAIGASVLLDPGLKLFTEFGATHFLHHALGEAQSRHLNFGIVID
ncbi:MAG: hypothetical protein ABJC74_11925 [Gemmatimonadota bacterium]